MSFREFLQEAIDPKLKAVVDKHNLKITATGKRIAEFEYSKEIEDEFKEAGYKLNWNNNTLVFDVTKI